MSKDWIKDAVKKPGALRLKAKKAGALNPDGTIKKSWIESKSKGNGRTAKQARLAMTFAKINNEGEDNMINVFDLLEADEESMVTDIEKDTDETDQDDIENKEVKEPTGGPTKGCTEVKEALVDSIKSFLIDLNELGIPVYESEEVMDSLYESLNLIVELAALSGVLETDEDLPTKSKALKVAKGVGIVTAGGVAGGVGSHLLAKKLSSRYSLGYVQGLAKKAHETGNPAVARKAAKEFMKHIGRHAI